MMARRIIPCLDVKNGRTVKGTNFVGLRDAGDPIELAKKYANEGADELVFLDITATIEKRKTLIPLVQKIGREINIPFTVGGGISSLELVDELLLNGADKVALNSAVISNPDLIGEIANKYGSQCVVVAIDGKCTEGRWEVFSHGGTLNTGKDLFEWAQIIVEHGAGELLFTSINKDGTKSGFEIEALNEICKIVNVPLIGSGGAGTIDHFVELFSETNVTAGLAASVFHFNEIQIMDLKTRIKQANILIRI